jgi:uncharacterized membrane protein YkvA (DUF1232 family)
MHAVYYAAIYARALRKPTGEKMTDRKPGKFVVPAKGGAMRGFVQRLKLIGRLMSDNRVSPFIKVLPLASLAYLIFPFDLAPGVALPIIGALDDAAVLWIGSQLFVELCPDEVVQEHMQALGGQPIDDSDDIVDADATDVNDNR